MRKAKITLLLLAMVFVLASCGSASLNEDEQYAIACIKEAPYVSEDDLADSLEDAYIVKGSDQNIKYVVADYYDGVAVRKAVFKDGSYYIDANDTFDTGDTSTANLDKLIAQRDIRWVESNMQPEDWEVIQLDIEKIKQALEQ